MLFVQATFLIFFAIVFLVYWSLPKLVLRKLFLLAASYVFYAAWDVRFLTLIIGCTLVNYWLGSLISKAQLYCDFSGYSDMAIALAGLLGLQLPRNFFFPYFSPNLGEFWRRWHITLSNWLKDYVYFPLGGSRGSEAAAYRNLMITFGLNGLWHGAAFGYILWGLGNGLGVAVYRLWTKSRLSGLVIIPHAVAVAMVVVFITLVRVPFRTPDLASTGDMYGIMFGLLRNSIA